jgi:hypothetical protein
MAAGSSAPTPVDNLYLTLNSTLDRIATLEALVLPKGRRVGYL